MAFRNQILSHHDITIMLVEACKSNKNRWYLGAHQLSADIVVSTSDIFILVEATFLVCFHCFFAYVSGEDDAGSTADLVKDTEDAN